jgi:hypothetical protein
MPARERGGSAAGFRAQLLARLRNQAQASRVAAQRLQQRVAFERFLARLGPSGEWVLKGGFALELRYGWGSRPTRDIDLRVDTDLDGSLVQLRTAMAESAGADHFSFELADVGQDLQGAPGGTQRLQVHARLAGETFAQFHIDVSSGDALVAAPDTLEGSDLLGFAGIAPVRFPIYPVIQHLAEKLHAYSLPRNQLNTRVKDLVDLVIMAGLEVVEGDALLAGVWATFAARASHVLPARLPEPPAAWVAPFARLAGETSLSTSPDLQGGFALAVAFWQPVLDGTVAGRHWDPRQRAWLGDEQAQPRHSDVALWSPYSHPSRGITIDPGPESMVQILVQVPESWPWMGRVAASCSAVGGVSASGECAASPSSDGRNRHEACLPSRHSNPP